MRKYLLILPLFFCLVSIQFFILSQANAQYTNSNWNIGEIQWLEASYSVDNAAHVRIFESDMNFSPNKKDSFQVPVWSDTDSAGTLITVTEEGIDRGIFVGLVLFTETSFSSGNTLRVTPGDTITAQYTDSTLPSPYAVGLTFQTVWLYHYNPYRTHQSFFYFLQ